MGRREWVSASAYTTPYFELAKSGMVTSVTVFVVKRQSPRHRGLNTKSNGRGIQLWSRADGVEMTYDGNPLAWTR